MRISDLVENCLIDTPEADQGRRTSVRLPLPSLAFTIYWFGIWAGMFLLNVAGLVNHLLTGQSVLINVVGLLVTVAIMAASRSHYRLLIIRREEQREANYWRVIEHQIKQPMPTRSPELVELEDGVRHVATFVNGVEVEAWNPEPGSWRKPTDPLPRIR